MLSTGAIVYLPKLFYRILKFVILLVMILLVTACGLLPGSLPESAQAEKIKKDLIGETIVIEGDRWKIKKVRGDIRDPILGLVVHDEVKSTNNNVGYDISAYLFFPGIHAQYVEMMVIYQKKLWGWKIIGLKDLEITEAEEIANRTAAELGIYLQRIGFPVDVGTWGYTHEGVSIWQLGDIFQISIHFERETDEEWNREVICEAMNSTGAMRFSTRYSIHYTEEDTQETFDCETRTVISSTVGLKASASEKTISHIYDPDISVLKEKLKLDDNEQLVLMDKSPKNYNYVSSGADENTIQIIFTNGSTLQVPLAIVEENRAYYVFGGNNENERYILVKPMVPPDGMTWDGTPSVRFLKIIK